MKKTRETKEKTHVEWKNPGEWKIPSKWKNPRGFLVMEETNCLTLKNQCFIKECILNFRLRISLVNTIN